MDLSQYVLSMIETEKGIEKRLSELPNGGDPKDGLSDILTLSLTTVKRHREALDLRLSMLSQGKEGSSDTSGHTHPANRLNDIALIYGLVNQAALGYAILHAVAHRYFDGPQQGTTAELAENHLKDYAQMVQSINVAISETTIREIGRLGQECQCQCPSCGLGLCLCSPHGTNTIVDIWRGSVGIPVTKGTVGMGVRPPRHGSSAAGAGIRLGDSVIAIDGRDVKDESWESIRTMQEAISGHQAGETVRIRLRRGTGDTEEISLVR